MGPLKPGDLEKRLGYTFRDKTLLERALAHSSFAYESQGLAGKDNELLEFLGDAVVGLAAAEYFFRAYGDRTEGELTKLKSSAANTQALAFLAKKLRLEKALRLGRGEERSGGRKKSSILAGAFEALAGAVFLDGGFEEARAVLQRLLAGSFRRPKTGGFLINNFKSALQEHFQKDGLPSPVYRTLTEKGPDHQKVFVVEVGLPDRFLAKAKGTSRKSAEQKAAQKALKRILGRRMKVLNEESFIVEKKG
ncbi:MAG: ribonuclease III [Candidatus Aminicenantes bacterium]|nr:ribonuclease III [Candidatus Aminicenantes bacterium]